MTISLRNGNSYFYDGFGRRIAKTVDGSTTYYIYDGDQVIEERDASGILQASYVYGSGIDEVLQMTRNEETYSYFYDGLGSVADITDSSGQIIETYIYTDYGKPTIKDNQGNTIPTSAIGNPYMFTGRRFDEETELYYYRSRYYSSAIGRFMQRDLYTWSPDDERILSRKKNLTDILASLVGIKFKTKSQRVNFERELFIFGNFQINPYYYSDSHPGFQYNEQVASNVIQSLGKHIPQLMHSYLYTFNNPVNYTDPDGKIFIITGTTITIFKIIASIVATVLTIQEIVRYINEQKQRPEVPGPAQEPYRVQPPRPLRVPCPR